ncbi:MAG: hypothetical protein O7G87_23050 [bacterium]|nr:hypothetical protein [bacterium]
MAMTYEEFSNRISDYLDGEMTPAQQAEMERQVEIDPACQALLKDMQVLTERLKRLPREEPSAGFNFALRSHLLMEVAKEQRWTHRIPGRRKLFAAAAAVILGLGIHYFLPETPKQQISGVGEVRLQQAGSGPVLDHRGSLKGLAKQSQPISGRQVQQVYGLASDSAKALKKQPVRRLPEQEVQQVKVKF